MNDLHASMPKTYRRELLSIILAKLVIIAILFFTFFSPAQRPHIGALETNNLLINQEKEHHVRP